jgi:hypothetical protein
MSLRTAWKKLRGGLTPQPQDDRALRCAKIALDMAKLLRIDPQKVVDAMREQISDKSVKVIDPDIAAVTAENNERLYSVI